MTARVDLLNIGLILLSLVLAISIPFELFLWAYAILGPLHYVTEINWLEKKNFFVRDKRMIWVLVLLSTITVIPGLLNIFPYFSNGGGTALHKIHYFLWTNVAVFLFVALALAAAMVYTGKKGILLLVAALAAGLGMLFKTNSLFLVVFGIFLASIIHVYLFTALFMLFGVLKKPGVVGYLSIVVLLLVPLYISDLDIDLSDYKPSEEAMGSIEAIGIGQLKLVMAYALGFLKHTEQYLQLSAVGVKVQIFIAFAYLYHYLNWFSKTTVIGWHKVISRKKLILLIGIWGVSVGLYFYNYLLGFSVLLLLSLLHVLLEFPLNVVSAVGIGKSFIAKKEVTQR